MADQAERDAWRAILRGQALGAYQLEECVGEGYFALVFEARRAEKAARVAVKVLLPNPDVGAALDFENEAALLRKLNGQDGVISFVDGGEATVELTANGIKVPLSVRFHVLTLASGTVAQLIQDPVARVKLDWGERIDIFRGAAKGVHQMHLAGVAHRDLKGSNCLLMIAGNSTRLKLADLGRAKDMSVPASIPIEHYISGRGDRRFAAPEFLWLQGGATPKDFIAADYYGLGSLLVELTTGHPLTSLAIGNVAEVMNQAADDLRRGQHSDLSSLRLHYRRVFSEVVDLMPRSIRQDALYLLSDLCDPVPSERMAQAPYSRERLLRHPLERVIRRADIMTRRLRLDAREERRNPRAIERLVS